MKLFCFLEPLLKLGMRFLGSEKLGFEFLRLSLFLFKLKLVINQCLSQVFQFFSAINFFLLVKFEFSSEIFLFKGREV